MKFAAHSIIVFVLGTSSSPAAAALGGSGVKKEDNPAERRAEQEPIGEDHSFYYPNPYGYHQYNNPYYYEPHNPYHGVEEKKAEVGQWVHPGCPGLCLGVAYDGDIEMRDCSEEDTLWENERAFGDDYFKIKLYERKSHYLTNYQCVGSRESIESHPLAQRCVAPSEPLTNPMSLVDCDGSDAGIFGRFGSEVYLYDAVCWLFGLGGSAPVTTFFATIPLSGCGTPGLDTIDGTRAGYAPQLVGQNEWVFMKIDPKALDYFFMN